MEIRKPSIRNAEAKFNKSAGNKIEDARDAAANAMSQEEFDNYERETDELMRKALNEEISDEDFKMRMEKLENPPNAVNFASIPEFSHFLKQTEVPDSEMHILEEQNAILSRANMRGLSGRHQLVFFRGDEGRMQSRPRVVVAFPDAMPAKERAKLYLKIREG